MKKLIFAAIAAIAFAGCSVSSRSNSSSGNDLYGVHDRLAIAQREKAEAEIRYLRAETQRLENEAYNLVYDEQEQVVLVEEYDGIYAQRLHRFDVPVYVLPSNYYTYTWDMWANPMFGFGFSFGLRSPWYDPWYNPWYDPWYGSWYGGWYGGWYGPGWNYGWHHHHYYDHHYGWGGYHGPVYYGNYYGSRTFDYVQQQA